MPLFKTPEVPDDIGQPMEIPAVLQYNLNTLYKFNAGGSFLPTLLFFFVLFLFIPPVIGGIPTFIFILPLVLFFVLSQRRLFGPKLASPEEKFKNEEIFREIYTATHSNFWSRIFIVLAASDKMEMYSEAPSRIANKIRDNIRDKHDFAKTDCVTGHTPKCAHRLPASVNTWLVKS